MAITIKNFISTTLPKDTASASSKYSPSYSGVSKAAVVKSIVVVNKTAFSITLNVEFKTGGGTARNVCAPQLDVPANSSLTIDSELTMSGTDELSLFAGEANCLDAVVSGIERDN